MTRRFFFLAALAPLTIAYSNTAPLLAWSSIQSNAIDSLPTTAHHASAIFDSVLADESICAFDAVVLVQHPGVHASDLRTLSLESDISNALSESPSARSYPYILDDQPNYTLLALAPELANKCQSKVVEYDVTSDDSFDLASKHTFVLKMPTLREEGKPRVAEMAAQSNELSTALGTLSAAFPKHLVIYAGQALQTHFARQQVSSVFHAPSNTTLAGGGILQRYQLLTPGLITVLLVVVFVFLPVLYLGINALASIQNPIKLDLPKGFNAQEKKTQ